LYIYFKKALAAEKPSVEITSCGQMFDRDFIFHIQAAILAMTKDLRDATRNCQQHQKDENATRNDQNHQKDENATRNDQHQQKDENATRNCQHHQKDENATRNDQHHQKDENATRNCQHHQKDENATRNDPTTTEYRVVRRGTIQNPRSAALSVEGHVNYLLQDKHQGELDIRELAAISKGPAKFKLDL
jgi:hypothetical protein